MISKVHGIPKGVYSVGLAVLLIVSIIHSASASPHAQSTLDGEKIFNGNCSVCHTIGAGYSDGPNLEGVTDKHNEQWLVNFISDPQQVIASGDPSATALVKQFNNFIMPNLGLSQAQVSDVIAYLAAQSGTNATPTPGSTPDAILVAGNLDNGKAIFLEAIPLANGGPPCIGCHSIDNVGILGGGALGPNLTQASVKYGNAGLAAYMANFPLPTMKIIFANKPLTANEQADLTLFIISAAGQPQPNKEWLIIGISVVGFLAVVVVAGFIWRGRLDGTRRNLVERAKARK